MIEAMTEELNIPIRSGGPTTFKKQLKKKGLEPDECYWVANEPSVRGRADLDLELDPPPNIAVEVEVSPSALNRLGIYAALGVSEVWRSDGHQIMIAQLQDDGTHAPVDRSPSFPWLPLAELGRFLGESATMDETRWIRSFCAWVRAERRLWLSSLKIGRSERKPCALSLAARSRRMTDSMRRCAELGEYIDLIRIGSPYDYGEVAYPAGAASWAFPVKHVHEGFWVDEPEARAHFRHAMKIRHSSLDRLNAAWATTYKSFIADGVLASYRVLIWPAGYVAEAGTMTRIRRWVEAGGALIVGDLGLVVTVDGQHCVERPSFRRERARSTSDVAPSSTEGDGWNSQVPHSSRT